MADEKNVVEAYSYGVSPGRVAVYVKADGVLSPGSPVPCVVFDLAAHDADVRREFAEELWRQATTTSGIPRNVLWDRVRKEAEGGD